MSASFPLFLRFGIFFSVLLFSLSNVSAQSAMKLVVPIVGTACYNGIDDDGDGLTDFPDDTGCTDKNDLSEHNLTATCSVSESSITLGQPVTWTVTPQGGSTNYIYSWSGPEVAGGTQSIVVTYGSVGDKNASVMVTSGVDTITVVCSGTVSVLSTDPNINPYPPTVGSYGGWGYVTVPTKDIIIVVPPIPETPIMPDLNAAPEKEGVLPGGLSQVGGEKNPSQSQVNDSLPDFNPATSDSNIEKVPTPDISGDGEYTVLLGGREMSNNNSCFLIFLCMFLTLIYGSLLWRRKRPVSQNKK